ncbi:hypothetical protein Poly41_38040 [Novipirellula artificiosorum]|uniref:Uncharacterized protein n=1 Tax=Novipirellula artificiosorum TaxID=2528016 RepID=A0A5C6DKA6_9BACT|nr:hypothetical protein Poly41_38040 [Novipirellula artificiosorum]
MHNTERADGGRAVQGESGRSRTRLSCVNRSASTRSSPAHLGRTELSLTTFTGGELRKDWQMAGDDFGLCQAQIVDP